eukprot:m.76471 g.76471  ORF g.76471 m.76471 type:complete len:143 (-) comp24899_c1_seq1:923-1351(-)
MKLVNASLRGLAMKPTAMKDWAAMVEEIKPLVDRGIIKGFMLGDELIWNNITWDELNLTATVVKTTFPQAFTYYNEGAGPLYGKSYAHTERERDVDAGHDHTNTCREREREGKKERGKERERDIDKKKKEKKHKKNENEDRK